MIRGVTEKTFENLQLGEGAFLKAKFTGTLSADNILSATRGGGTLNITPAYRTRSIDGIPANTKEAKAVDSIGVTASFVALEITPELVRRACGVADLDTANKIITLRHEVKTTDFEDLYWLGEVSDGRKVQITFKNAFNENGLSLRTQPNNEGELSLSFSGNYSVADLDTPPVEIEFIDA
jgi:hypothetical protein